MARKAQPRNTLPSGIEVSANGNYYYWKCTISGQETFATADRFKEIIAKYGSEANLVKTYVLRSVQKYVAAGFDSKYVKDLIKHAKDGKLPAFDANLKERKKALKTGKKPRQKRLKKFATGEENAQAQTKSGSFEEVKQKVYPWSGNPDYFKGTPVPLSIEDETKSSCMYPQRYLDDLCAGCSVFDRCQSALKITEEARRIGKAKKEAPKVKALNLLEGAEAT